MDDDHESSASDQPDESAPSDGAPQLPGEGDVKQDVEQETATAHEEAAAAGAGDEAPKAGATTGPDDQPSDAISTGERASGPRVEIGVAEGDLRVVGGAVHVTLHQRRGRRDEQNGPNDRDGTLSFDRVGGGAELQVPDGVEVTVREVRGDLSVQAVNGLLEVARTGGDVTIDGIATARLTSVRGDLRIANGGEVLVRDVTADVDVTGVGRLLVDGRVRGDFTAHEVEQVELRGTVGGDVEIERCGDVTLQGATGADLSVTQCAGRLSIGAVSGDATLTQVREARLGAVGGDLAVRRCLGAVAGTTVSGDATLVEVESVQLSTVGGDLKAQRVGGQAQVRSAGGDAKFERVGGRIAMSFVGSDLDVNDAPSGVSVEKVGGDVDLISELGPGAEYTVFAGGDVTLRVRGEVNARFVAQAGGEVSTNLPLSVEHGRRRHLVGVLGRGDAAVTLRSGGDIRIAAADKSARRGTMSDEREGPGQGQGPADETTGTSDAGRGGAGARMWEGSFGGKRFRLRWEQAPGHAGMHFQGPIDEEDPDAVGGPYSRAFGFEWDRGRGARTYGEYEERLRDLGDKAERVARKAAEQAQELAEEAARKTRETDWEAVGREVRGAISKAMGELEDAFTRVRSEWERPGPGGTSGSGPSPRGGNTAQRVRIEQEDEQGPSSATSQPGTTPPGAPESGASSQRSYGQPTGGASYGPSGSSYGASDQTASSQPQAGQSTPDDREARRRQILEQLRSGQIALDEAERRLNDLR